MQTFYRVSEVLSMYKDFSGIDPEVLQRKAEIGTNVHACINAFYQDFFLPAQDREIGYFDSFIKWHEENGHIPELLEKRMFGKGTYEGLTGQMDMFLNIKGEPTLIDFKCSASADLLCWPLQGYYYLNLLFENKIPEKSKMMFLQLDSKGGSPKQHWFEVTIELEELALASWTVFKAKLGRKFKKMDKKTKKDIYERSNTTRE